MKKEMVMKFHHTVILACLLGVLMISPFSVTGAGADTVELPGDSALKTRLKDCTSPECRQELQGEAQQIFDAAGRSFGDDFTGTGNEIIMKHMDSLTDELFYHLEKIKYYSRFRDINRLEKLKKLKKNHIGFQQGSVTEAEFTRNVKRIEQEARSRDKSDQEFVDHKVQRMSTLCSSFKDNRENLKARAFGKQARMNDSLNRRMNGYKENPVWKAFVSGADAGKRMRSAIRLASKEEGDFLLKCMGGMFVTATSGKPGGPLSSDVVDQLKD